MITRRMDKQITEPAQLVEQDFHKPDQWKAEIMALAGNDEQKLNALIPDAYSGEKVQDRLNAYAEDMARKVRLSYPTQVIGRMYRSRLRRPIQVRAAPHRHCQDSQESPAARDSA